MTRCFSSILVISVRFSLSRNDVTSTGTCTCTAAVLSFIDSSWTMRRICSALDSVSRMWPVPLQRGQVMWLPSERAGRRRWRLISSRPNFEIDENWTRARSERSASRRRVSTSRRFFDSSMSMKSTTIRPPRSRRRIWRAISSAASRLVRVAVSSMSEPRVDRAELTSTETSASVWSMTIAPPDGRLTVRANAVSIWCSIWNRLNRAASSR